MTPRRGEPLPAEITAVIDRLVDESGAIGASADRIRDDMERHFLDGLASGRSIEELIRSFGDPAVAADLLRRQTPHANDAIGAGRATGLFGAFLTDVRLTLRTLRASPVFAVTVVSVLALGIGANAVTFTVLNEVLLKPLPVVDQEALVNVIAEVPGGNSFTGFSVADFETLREQSNVTDDLAAMSGITLRYGEGSGDEPVVATLASPDYFDLLGVPASMGSVRLPPFRGWGADRVAVVSERFWRTRLGSNPNVVGSTIRLNGTPITVLGVASPGFTGTFIGFPSDLWLPLSMAEGFIPGFDAEDRELKFLEIFGRRRAGRSVSDVDAGLDAIAAEIERAYPVINRGHRVRVVPLTGLDDSLRVGVLSFVAILVAVSVLVLIISCLNVGSILLVRAMSRERELAIRIAVGAGVGRLARQLLTETLVLVSMGVVVALVLAVQATASLRDFVTGVSGGIGLDLSLDRRVIALTATAALGAALFACLVPAAHVLRKDPAGALRRASDFGSTGARLRGALVVGQVALSAVLVISASLFLRALGEGLTTDPGFDADRVAGFTVRFDSDRFEEATARGLQQSILGQLRDLPGVDHVAASASRPLGVARSPASVTVPGVEPPPGEAGFLVDSRSVGAGYFDAVGVELVAGRAPTEAEDRMPDGVAVISRAFRDAYFPGGSGVGQLIEVDGDPLRVVAVAEDVRYILQDDTPDPLVYRSFAGSFRESMVVLMRSGGDPADLRARVQDILVAADPDQPLVTLATERESLQRALLPQRVGAVIVGATGLIALLLASIGLYGLVQYTVTRQTRALGIRLALGSGRGGVMASVMRRGFLFVGVGLAFGGSAAVWLTPGLEPFLLGVRPHDPLTYGVVLTSFAIVTLVATLAPALRAARIDPVNTLRSD